MIEILMPVIVVFCSDVNNIWARNLLRITPTCNIILFSDFSLSFMVRSVTFILLEVVGTNYSLFMSVFRSSV